MINSERMVKSIAVVVCIVFALLIFVGTIWGEPNLLFLTVLGLSFIGLTLFIYLLISVSEIEDKINQKITE